MYYTIQEPPWSGISLLVYCPGPVSPALKSVWTPLPESLRHSLLPLSPYTSTKLNHLEFFKRAILFSALFFPIWPFLRIECPSIPSPHLANTYSSFKTQFKWFHPEHVFWTFKNKDCEGEEESHFLKSIIPFNPCVNLRSRFHNHPKFTNGKPANFSRVIQIADNRTAVPSEY